MLGKYIKIYLWQFISILLNFGTLFVVTPFLSSNRSLFGIYTIIVSLNIFLSYADFGFISAGLKYASESYARNDREEEVKIVGFVAFIFTVFVGLFMVMMLGISLHPEMIVNGLKPDETKIARALLVMLALFSPTFILQRMLQVIFAVRLEDYHFQRLLIVANVCKIASTFYFFHPGNYSLVGYFLFTQLCNAVAMLAGIWQVKKRLHYDLGLLLRSFKYSKELFDKTKKLAFSSVILTVCWILYYQLDPFVIGKMIGAEAVAVYAIGLTMITYIRSLFGILFSPFTARFNHYVGANDIEGLKKVFVNVLVITLPLTVFPVICLALTSGTLVMNWVGPGYMSSVYITQLLILCYLFSFISSPAGILIMAYERVKMIYYTSAMLPVIFWVGVATTYSFWGLTSFAVFKLVSFFLAALAYFLMSCQILHISIGSFVKKILLPAVLPILVIVGACLLVRSHIPVGHSKINLFWYLVVIGVISMLGLVVYYITSGIFRQYVLGMLQQLRPKLFYK
ncbi:O-antigen/teichoic acid export membrane protein [Chitinophaga niastensis]|uniref:O-antigen/teichoic acid export membrane protein n=1 Tax=Chitinophaga niastensis TaxID=536980 RepID=A0A2P8HRY2_CHINA|nr:polysaccharide biosynthesis protein [Chitinophaga niastensis]PSL48944.1 O-antigen/teichoic acid export membrane protein [Chitinophaga niastensis]